MSTHSGSNSSNQRVTHLESLKTRIDSAINQRASATLSRVAMELTMILYVVDDHPSDDAVIAMCEHMQNILDVTDPSHPYYQYKQAQTLARL